MLPDDIGRKLLCKLRVEQRFPWRHGLKEPLRKSRVEQRFPLRHRLEKPLRELKRRTKIPLRHRLKKPLRKIPVKTSAKEAFAQYSMATSAKEAFAQLRREQRFLWRHRLKRPWRKLRVEQKVPVATSAKEAFAQSESGTKVPVATSAKEAVTQVHLETSRLRRAFVMPCVNRGTVLLPSVCFNMSVKRLLPQTHVARGPLTWQDMFQLLKTHLFFSFSVMTHMSRHIVVVPTLAAPLLTDTRRSTVGVRYARGHYDRVRRVHDAFHVRGMLDMYVAIQIVILTANDIMNVLKIEFDRRCVQGISHHVDSICRRCYPASGNAPVSSEVELFAATHVVSSAASAPEGDLIAASMPAATYVFNVSTMYVAIQAVPSHFASRRTPTIAALIREALSESACRGSCSRCHMPATSVAFQVVWPLFASRPTVGLPTS